MEDGAVRGQRLERRPAEVMLVTLTPRAPVGAVRQSREHTLALRDKQQRARVSPCMESSTRRRTGSGLLGRSADHDKRHGDLQVRKCLAQKAHQFGRGGFVQLKKLAALARNLPGRGSVGFEVQYSSAVDIGDSVAALGFASSGGVREERLAK